MRTLTPGQLRKVIAAAHGQGRLAVVHVGSFEEAATAAEAGVDGLAHISTDQAADPAFVPLARGWAGS